MHSATHNGHAPAQFGWLRPPVWVPVLLTVLLLALSACGTTIQTVREAVPEALLVPCEAAYEDYSTNGGLAKSIESLKSALTGCNLDKEAIRQWGKGA
jgi:hypothetical protein